MRVLTPDETQFVNAGLLDAIVYSGIAGASMAVLAAFTSGTFQYVIPQMAIGAGATIVLSLLGEAILLL